MNQYLDDAKDEGDAIVVSDTIEAKNELDQKIEMLTKSEEFATALAYPLGRITSLVGNSSLFT